MQKIITTYFFLLTQSIPFRAEIFNTWSEKALHGYLYALTEFLPFATGAFAISLLTSFTRSPNAALYALGGGVAIAIGRGLLRKYRFNISPEMRVKEFWFEPTETCLYELAIGSAMLIFATATLGGNVFEVALFVIVLTLSLAAFWKKREVLDLSVLQN
jgi:hypothetical protein